MHPRLKLQTFKYWQLQSAQSGDVGIEIELEGDRLPRIVPGWEAKKDNSLRGANGRVIQPEEGDREDTPREYVTMGAVSTSDVLGLVNRLRSMAENSTIRISPRTSTHIHVNMQDTTVREVIGYIILWAIVEPLLLRACGPDRNGNLFCLPFSETYDLSTSVIPSWCAAMRDYAQGRYWVKRGKYACLNTDPLHSFGTLEARCFPASVDPLEIHKWCQWVTNIKKIVRQYPDETFETLVTDAYANPGRIVSDVFGDTLSHTIAYPDTPSELIRAGVETAYEIWKAFQPVFQFEGKVKEKKMQVKKPLYWADEFNTETQEMLFGQPPAPISLDDLEDGDTA